MPEPVPDYGAPPPPPQQPGPWKAFAIALGACAVGAALAYGLVFSSNAAGDGVIGLLLLALLGLPLAFVVTGVVMLITGRTNEGIGYALGGVAGFVVGFGMCFVAIAAL